MQEADDGKRDMMAERKERFAAATSSRSSSKDGAEDEEKSSTGYRVESHVYAIQNTTLDFSRLGKKKKVEGKRPRTAASGPSPAVERSNVRTQGPTTSYTAFLGANGVAPAAPAAAPPAVAATSFAPTAAPVAPAPAVAPPVAPAPMPAVAPAPASPPLPDAAQFQQRGLAGGAAASAPSAAATEGPASQRLREAFEAQFGGQRLASPFGEADEVATEDDDWGSPDDLDALEQQLRSANAAGLSAKYASSAPVAAPDPRDVTLNRFKEAMGDNFATGNDAKDALERDRRMEFGRALAARAEDAPPVAPPVPGASTSFADAPPVAPVPVSDVGSQQPAPVSPQQPLSFGGAISTPPAPAPAPPVRAEQSHIPPIAKPGFGTTAPVVGYSSDRLQQPKPITYYGKASDLASSSQVAQPFHAVPAPPAPIDATSRAPSPPPVAQPPAVEPPILLDSADRPHTPMMLREKPAPHLPPEVSTDASTKAPSPSLATQPPAPADATPVILDATTRPISGLMLKTTPETQVAPPNAAAMPPPIHHTAVAPPPAAVSAPSVAAMPLPAVAPDANLLQAEAEAKDALLDWLETHGGYIALTGEMSNVAAASDAVSWSQRFHTTCGRMVPFLRKHGISAAGQSDVIVGFEGIE